MGRYLARRLLQFIPVFIGATLLIFLMVWAIPGDPIAALAGDRYMPDAVREQIRDRYNLNDPLIVQYGKYIGGVFQGDFGDDFRGRPVTDLLSQRLPITVRLALLAFGFEGVLGMVLGSVSLAYVARLPRTGVVENLRADYVRTATAKGLVRRRVVGVHALRNSLIPVVTFLAVDLGAVMVGAIITETIFNIPGIGRAVFEGVHGQQGR